MSEPTKEPRKKIRSKLKASSEFGPAKEAAKPLPPAPEPEPEKIGPNGYPERPATPDELHKWIAVRLGYDIQRKALITAHSAPFDYLAHSFFEWEPVDSVVWAARGAGKTFLGAVATAAELYFKPGIQVRILAGSVEQASRMYAHLVHLCATTTLEPWVETRTARRIAFKNGSACELLAQSETSVRGTRVQRLRCDEVDLFDDAIWEAAQLTTRSEELRDGKVCRAGIECLSTMHEPFGLMSRLVKDAAAGKRRLFKWGIVDVLKECPGSRDCRWCPLRTECAGNAKRKIDVGHVTIDDAIRMKGRVSRACWESEMLCIRTRRTNCVYPEFDPRVHVVREVPGEVLLRSTDRSEPRPPSVAPLRWVCGMDFGYRAPAVVLWGAVDGEARLWIVDERRVSGETTAEHAAAIRKAPWPEPEWIGADPAGKGANGQTGLSDVEVLRRAGFVVRTRSANIRPGIGLVRARLSPATGPVRLLVHERCTQLIQALTEYHYSTRKLESEEPVKDGPDHACDALRYLVVNLEGGEGAKFGRYIG